MITVLTPTFNREQYLVRLYNSLLTQTSSEFCWLIIDDGSTDKTEELVYNFLKENKIKIEYHKKVNGGKHTALNFSHNYIKGDLVWIVDSDDFVTKDAVETIVNDWKKYKRNKRIAGITYLRGDVLSHPLGGYTYPFDEFISDSIRQHVNKKKVPDACEVIRTDIFKRFRFPEYEGEKFLGESFLWNQIGYKYDTVYINKVLYICEYIEGGLTKSGRRLRITCPLGGMDNSKTYFHREVVIRQRIKNAILFDCYGFFAKFSALKIIRKGNDPFVTVLIPFGLLLYIYWKLKYLS